MTKVIDLRHDTRADSLQHICLELVENRDYQELSRVARLAAQYERMAFTLGQIDSLIEFGPRPGRRQA